MMKTLTRQERMARSASPAQQHPLQPPPLPLQQAVTDQRRLLTGPWVMFFRWLAGQVLEALNDYLQGTHAERLALAEPANYRPGTLYWEEDRTVLYQVRIDAAGEPQWVYVLGTMEAPLASRPADLGPYDAGFQFAATDTGQLYVWDGTAWVDVSRYPYATYGTHAARLAQPVGTLTDGALWAETDRGNALYQIQAGVWWYIAGTMFGTLAPDQRPADLGVHDAGFCFRTSVPPAREFLWSQTAWVEITPQSSTVQAAYATGNMALTTIPQNIPGCALTLARAGQYLISGVFDLGSYDPNVYLVGGLSGYTPLALLLTNEAGFRATVAQQWAISVTAGFVAQLNAYKTSGTGTSQINVGNTSITAVWIAP